MNQIFTLSAKMLLTILIVNCFGAFAKTVEFPSTRQAGEAQLTSSDNRWTFSNDLFSASFILNNGKLFFDGSPEMNLQGGTEIFEYELANGTKVKASEMTWGNIEMVDLQPNPSIAKHSEQLPGKALTATLTKGTLTFKWRAVLRNGSHYLRTELSAQTSANIQMKNIIPMTYIVANEDGQAVPAVTGNTRGAVLTSERIFAGLETPMGINSVIGGNSDQFNLNAWTTESWKELTTAAPSGITNLGFTDNQIAVTQGEVNIDAAGSLQIKFQYSSGNHRLNLAGVDILQNGSVVASDYHIGFTGGAASNNSYTFNVPAAGKYTLRYFGEVKTESILSSGNITLTGPTVTVAPSSGVAATSTLIGKWSRNTTLQTTDTFKVSTVVGLLAEGQKRRSFLAYHERERAVPWRSFIHYNSWYELNINRNNDSDPLKRMSEAQCAPILEAWKENLYDPYGLSIDAFVWDDGWDEFNSLWGFHIGFPNGFENLDTGAKAQNAGIGTWLGPVGGYGSSKSQRIDYWNRTHPNNQIGNFELSNKEYFDAFLGRCSQMVNDYDMRYFKFDGISTQFSATGPSGEEDAEGIIKVLSALRKKRSDIFFNCTVGTWASPFWFHYADAVWRQENDFDQVGDQGDSREKWITYRDRLVHQNFVTNSPLCPINSLMTHGLIVSKFGPPASMPHNNTPATVAGIKKEMHAAFACGSGIVELYVDNDLMTAIGTNKELWKELAACIKWHRDHADVLADIHWVGGNPWDGSKANVYGWASWNKEKSTLALRNPSGSMKVFKTTLRAALDIPAYITGKIHLTNAFEGQRSIIGITDKELDIDTELNFGIAAFELIVFNGTPSGEDNAIDEVKGDRKSMPSIYGAKDAIEVRNVAENSKIEILSLNGTKLKIVAENAKNFTIPFFKGVYVVRVINENGTTTFSEKVVCE